ncbi:hypothetical protein E8L90_05370 [Brevibacillus antibioticus]|uniref:Uncharacterized protein n=1 Tax=Brevibacillus antibioticus TaxID=2570228 RepID=A0A4V5TIR2_9BACL|nr:hypothetical protein [Brevibacillus antibioticus]TKI54923.1 hypothetical protein E8L90_05370 [Brevibacillus antibioticus]
MISKGKQTFLSSLAIATFMVVAAPVSASPILLTSELPSSSIQSNSDSITTQACNPCRVKSYLYPKKDYSRSDFTSTTYITVGGVEYFFWYIDDEESTATHWKVYFREE